MGLIKAVLEAIHGEDDRIAGRAVSRLTLPLLSTNTTSATVESTIGFGEFTDATGNARISVNGELIDVSSRTEIPGNMQFLGLTRGVNGTRVQSHPAGSVVFDQSENTSAYHHVRRGFLVNYAQGEDLDVIGRNNGLHKCGGLDQETWRRLIKCMSYLPKNTDYAIERVLTAYFDDTTSWEVFRRPNEPYRIYVRVTVPLETSIRGRFILTGGTQRLTTGLTTVTTPWPIRTVAGVYADTVAARRGMREGLTNYFSGGGSFVLGASSITLGSSPGAIGTPVIVDYTAYDGVSAGAGYHYLAENEAVLDAGDRWAYLSDPTAALTCLLNQVRPSGFRVFVSLRS